MIAVTGERTGGLGYEVLHSESITLDLPDRLPDGGGRTWAPLSTTLVHDSADAVLVESGDGGRDAWRLAIDAVAALAPHRIVAGHRNPARDDDPARAVTETRQYLDDVDDLLPRQENPISFFQAMVERHPGHLNPSTLWGSALALYARK